MRLDTIYDSSIGMTMEFTFYFHYETYDNNSYKIKKHLKVWVFDF